MKYQKESDKLMSIIKERGYYYLSEVEKLGKEIKELYIVTREKIKKRHKYLFRIFCRREQDALAKAQILSILDCLCDKEIYDKLTQALDKPEQENNSDELIAKVINKNYELAGLIAPL